MAKKPSTLANMVVSLMVITAVSGGVLGLVYGMTKDAIEKVEEKKNEEAVKEVLPFQGIHRPDTLVYTDEQNNTIKLPCTLLLNDNNEVEGAAIKTSENGFGGKIELMVGVTVSGTISGVSVLSHTETPGLGANMDGKFKDQFANRRPGDNFVLEVTKTHDGMKVDAITAATISSRAFTKAVDKAFKAFEANKPRFKVTPTVDEAVADVEDINENTEGGQENE